MLSEVASLLIEYRLKEGLELRKLRYSEVMLVLPREDHGRKKPASESESKVGYFHPTFSPRPGARERGRP
jgi:hypothetical protein